MAQDIPVPPVPYKTPLVDQGGLLTVPWIAWFRQLFTRVGSNFNVLIFNPMTGPGDMMFGDSIGDAERLAGSISATKHFLIQTGSGTASDAPVWGLIVAGDLPSISMSGDVTGSGSSGSIVTTVAKISGTSVGGVTGSGNVVFSISPTLSNPVVGTQTQGDGSTKAASTSYVDIAVANAIVGINPAVAVQAATTSASDTSGFTYTPVAGIGDFFTGTINTAVTIDGYTFTATGQRLLVKNDTQSPSGAFNGVYSLTQLQTALLAPVFTRATDYNQPSDINNTGAIPVINGTVNTTTSWVQTAKIVTVGTTPLVFVRFTRNPADYLLVANNLSDVGTKATAFNNLSPMTTLGDTIIGGASGAAARLALGTRYQSLQANATTVAYDAIHLDQSAAVTGVLPNGNTTATSSNTNSTIVARDSSGNFSAGTITATFSGNITGTVTGSCSGTCATFTGNLSGDVSSSGMTTTIGANKVTLAMMAQMATASFLGRTTASTGNVEVLTAAQATAILNAMVGDSGSGGTKGLVPAPASGDAAAAKFLKADATWAVPSGGGSSPSAAVKSDQTTATSTTVFVNPGVQQYHSSACKAWINYDNLHAIRGSYNVTSLTNTAGGDNTVNFTVSMSSANYSIAGTGGHNTTSIALIIQPYNATSPQTGSCRIQTTDQSNTLYGAAINSVTFFGVQ